MSTEPTKYPGISMYPDGRILVRATLQVLGKRKQKRSVLDPGTPLSVAVAEKERLLKEIERGEANPIGRPAKTTIADFAVRWLELKARRIKKVSTRERYLQCLRDHILPHIGELYVEALKRSDIVAFAAELEAARKRNGEPYSAETLIGWWSIAKQLIKDAVAEYGIPDPTFRVRPPSGRGREKKREQRTLTTRQLARLLNAARQYHPDWALEIEVLATTGMRPGELYALEWRDLDVRERTFTVRRSHWRGNVGTTKTDAQRIVPLSPETIARLERHRIEQIEAQHPGLELGLVFPSEDGQHRFTQALSPPLKAVARDAGIKQRVTPLVLRRSFNSIMLAQGVDHVVLRSVMGHSNEAMTERYAGIGIEAKRDALQLLSVPLMCATSPE